MAQLPKDRIQEVNKIKCLEPRKIKNYIVRCGQCIMCRKQNAFNWAQRVNDELSTNYGKGIVITLTYKNKTENKYLNLNKVHAQKFIKRLRKNTGKKFKYILCGEYGEKDGRPHYHVLIIGLNGREVGFRRRFEGDKYFSSKIIDYTWNKGNALCDTINTKSVFYVTGYLMKNLNWRRKKDMDLIFQKPFLLASKGIGEKYLDMYREQIAEKKSNPRYYRKKLNQGSSKVTSRQIRKREMNMMKMKDVDRQKAISLIALVDDQQIKNILAKERMLEINRKEKL